MAADFFFVRHRCVGRRAMIVVLQFVAKPDVDAFREAEVHALADLAGARVRFLGASEADPAVFQAVYARFHAGEWPVVYAELPSREVAEAIAARSVLLRAVCVAFCEPCATVDNVVACLTNGNGDGLLEPLQPWITAPLFRYEVESFERKIDNAAKVELIRRFKPVPHTGTTVLTEAGAQAFRVFLLHDRSDKSLRFAFFGALLAESSRSYFLDRYSLPLRRYIGTTTMPPELTFLMANLGRVTRGMLVMDPFVGTGATLISASHYGAATIGFDMDGRVLRSGAIVGPQALAALEERQAARKKRSGTEDTGTASFHQNFTDYGLPWADAARLNFTVACQAFTPTMARLHNAGFLDAIVTDPPYGIREQQRTVAAKGEAENGAPRMSQVPWSSGEMVLDLVAFAASALVVGGHLVYWHPTSRLAYTDAEIPRHPCMELLCNVEQGLSIKIARRLVVMRKVAVSSDPMADADAMRRDFVSPANVRKMMNETTEGNEDYFAYRQKREAIRDSRNAWRASHAEAEAAPLSKAERQATQIQNRARNVAERARKQETANEAQRRANEERRAADDGGAGATAAKRSRCEDAEGAPGQ
jgi:tRNA (guanine10-N2)-methyltransferase